MIEQIYEATIDDEAYAALPRSLADAVGARSATLQVVENNVPVHIAAAYFTPEMSDYYVANDIAQFDIWNTLVSTRALTGRALTSDLILSRADFTRTAFFNDFFRVFGDDTGVSLGAVIPTDLGFVGLGLHRATTAAAYAEADISRLDDALPHLRRMMEIRSRLGGLTGRAEGLESALHTQRHGIVIADRSGRITFANHSAERLIRTGDALRMVGGKLVAVDPECQASLKAAIGGASTGQGGAAIWARRVDGTACRLVISPHRSTAGLLGVLVMFDDSAGDAPDCRQSLRALYGLTAAEADLAQLMFDGLSPKEAAQVRGVALATVQTQLKSIRSRTETTRHGELVTLVAGLSRLTSET